MFGGKTLANTLLGKPIHEVTMCDVSIFLLEFYFEYTVTLFIPST